MSNELATRQSSIELFGARDEVRELATRLLKAMPSARSLTESEALTLAQISVAHGLDPYNGEAWYIPGSGVMVGVKGLRRSARRAADREGGTFWTEFQAIMPSEVGAGDKAVVYRCIIRDTVSMQAYGKSVNLLTTAGMPYKEAVAALGPAPSTVGIGIATPDERSKMEIHQRARKRAEADAIKQRYDVDFGSQARFTDDDALEAEFTELTGAQVERMPEAQAMNELGFETEYHDEPPAAQPAIVYPAHLLEFKSSKTGQRYVDAETPALQEHLTWVEQAIKKATDEAHKSELVDKRDAIKEIIKLRPQA